MVTFTINIPQMLAYIYICHTWIHGFGWFVGSPRPRQWGNVRLDDVEPQDRLKKLSRLDRVKLRVSWLEPRQSHRQKPISYPSQNLADTSCTKESLVEVTYWILLTCYRSWKILLVSWISQRVQCSSFGCVMFFGFSVSFVNAKKKTHLWSWGLYVFL